MSTWLEKDLAVKVVSVFVAAILWFQVMVDQNPLTPRTFQSIPLKVANLDNGMVMLECAPQSVLVTVQSPKRVISRLQEDEIKATVDLKGVEPGRVSLPIDVSVPKGVQLVEVVPAQASLVLDVQTTRKARVDVRVNGTPAEDFVNEQALVKTTEVTLQGPKTRVDAVQRVVGDVDITGATSDVVKAVDLKAIDVDGREVKMVSLNPKTVEVRIPMKQLPPHKLVSVKPEFSGMPQEGFRVVEVSCQPRTVKVRGPAERLQYLESVRTVPVNIAGQSYDVEKSAEVVLPPGCSMVEPRTVLVKVLIGEDRTEKTFHGLPIRLRNVSIVYKFQLTPTTVDVVVEGRKDELEKLRPEDIEVFVDARNLGEGSTDLRVQVEVPDRFTFVKVTPDITNLVLRPR